MKSTGKVPFFFCFNNLGLAEIFYKIYPPKIFKKTKFLLNPQVFNGNGENVVKSEDKVDDVKIKTAEISSKFKFFETYKPSEQEKKQFRITPPRDGVVKVIQFNYFFFQKF